MCHHSMSVRRPQHFALSELHVHTTTVQQHHASKFMSEIRQVKFEHPKLINAKSDLRHYRGTPCCNSTRLRPAISLLLKCSSKRLVRRFLRFVICFYYNNYGRFGSSSIGHTLQTSNHNKGTQLPTQSNRNLFRLALLRYRITTPLRKKCPKSPILPWRLRECRLKWKQLFGS